MTVQLLPKLTEIRMYNAVYERTSRRVHEPALKGANAADLAEAESLWRKSFPTAIREGIWSPEFDYGRFDPSSIRANPACYHPMRQIYDLAQEYMAASVNVDSKRLVSIDSTRPAFVPKEDEGKKILNRINSLLFEKIAKEQPVCFAPTAISYAISSFSGDFPFLLNGHPMGTEEAIEGYRLLTTFLYNWGHIKILTPRLRCDFGGIWSRKKTNPSESINSPYEILGGYSCSNSYIGIDPGLAPYDMSASLIHELDHLMRDKLVGPEVAPLDPASNIILDESLASIHAGLSQIRNLWKAKNYSDVIPPSYDFSFFTNDPEDGNLLNAWLNWMPPTRTVVDSKTGERLHGFDSELQHEFVQLPLIWHLALTFLNQQNISHESIEMMGIDPRSDYGMRKLKSTSFQLKTYKAMAEAYKVKPPPDFLVSLRIHAREMGTDLSPLAEWVRLAIPSHQSYDSEHRRWLQYIYYNLHQRMGLESASCKSFIKAMEQGALSGYIGASESSGGGASSAESSNSNPESKPTRPGADGTRPGADGTRPTVRGVRPCLRVAP